jgi:hypothetical protein
MEESQEKDVTGYAAFLERKAQSDLYAGFDPAWVPDFLFDFQRTLVTWATRKGKAALFADCGLGKTPMQLVWAENVVRHTQHRVLILTPLAVAAQTLAEARKFGIEAGHPSDGLGIAVTNYERLHLIDAREYVGVVCDESSILKNFDGVRRGEITHLMRKLDYRLLCTATAAPNDYIELGTSSEALGELGYMDMLGRFFRNTQNTIKPMVYRHHGKNFAQLDEAAKWRFKGHAETAFWRWVCSWARAIRRPSDVGGDDARFVLPQLVEREQVVSARAPAPGMLFDLPAVGMKEERDEMKRTVQERCERAAACVADTGKPAVMWCNRNDEGDLLATMVPDARQVSGADEIEEKEETFAAFTAGQLRVLVIKPKIGAWGLNWQHCAHMTVFPSHSYEQYYQAVRRCWRFGQTDPVVVDVITTEGGAGIAKNLQRKSAQADAMFARLVQHMNEASRVARATPFTESLAVPSWL